MNGVFAVVEVRGPWGISVGKFYLGRVGGESVQDLALGGTLTEKRGLNRKILVVVFLGFPLCFLDFVGLFGAFVVVFSTPE